MLILVVLLVVTNLATFAVIGVFLLRRLDHPAPGPAVARALDASAPPPEISSSATRQVISIEILNPIELAGTRGRLAGLAGSIVPGITKRVVHDQAMKMVRRVLVEEKVVADVRLHTIRPAPRSAERRPTAPAPTVQPVEPKPAVRADERVGASEPAAPETPGETEPARDRRPSDRRSSGSRSSSSRSSDDRSSDRRSSQRRSSGSSRRTQESRDGAREDEPREHRSSSGKRRGRSSYDPSRSRSRDRSRDHREQDDSAALTDSSPSEGPAVADLTEPTPPPPGGSDPGETRSGPRPGP